MSARSSLGAFWVEFLRLLEGARAWRAPGDLRSHEGPLGAIAPRAGLPVAALHCPFLEGYGHALPPRSARARRRRAPRSVQRRRPGAGQGRVTHVLERLATVAPKVCELLEAAEEDLIAFYAFPPEHWTKLRSTNPLERSTRRSAGAPTSSGSFPNDRRRGPARRRPALRTERRMARAAPLPVSRVDGACPRRRATKLARTTRHRQEVPSLTAA